MSSLLDFSVITITLNSGLTVADTLNSVFVQKNVKYEHIIKDGGSSDDTLAIARRYNSAVHVLVRDDTGIYDAMNQGFSIARGEFICFLNSDDYFVDENVLSDVANAFETSGADIVYGDIDIINSDGFVIRQWKTGNLRQGRLIGQQIPHPAFFVRRTLLSRVSPVFDTSYRISADFKQQLILINSMSTHAQYLPRSLVKMRTGGMSTRSFSSRLRGLVECNRAYTEVTGRSGVLFVAAKVARKIPMWVR